MHPFSDVFYSDFYADGVKEDYFVKLKERVQGEQTVEIMVHPAYIDPELVKRSSYVMDVKELRILTESELPEGIELVKFNRKRRLHHAVVLFTKWIEYIRQMPRV